MSSVFGYLWYSMDTSMQCKSRAKRYSHLKSQPEEKTQKIRAMLTGSLTGTGYRKPKHDIQADYQIMLS